ncbi:carbohydrate-binding module family 50 protein [Amniculicola lignicola CBS 123094]|uniref:Carbohydrate-binding module family 50 protein n=1 Tax=Amniculicola lignicola CBS 123094 TaxID=1392246 RepID=A0A6A5X3F7_9PLEO|nr:carbohydrate-binding module family 50 protein [Amniculicola lignicola CBS 123094]
MPLRLQKAAWLAASVILATVIAQDSSPGGPVHPGQPSNCNGWHTVVFGDNCQSVARRYGISMQQFLAWNPAVSSDCLSNFWLESAYCVRVSQSSSKPATSTSVSRVVSQKTSTSAAQTTTTSAPKTSSISVSKTSTPFNSTYSILNPITSWNVSATSTDKIYPPTKTLAGQMTICNSWHRVVPGDTCELLVSKFGLGSVDVLTSWNPAANEDCGMLIADYWVCVGVQQQTGNTDLVWETLQPGFTEPPEPTKYIPITLSTADSSFTPVPSHGPMPSNCKVFHQTTADQNCNDLVKLYGYFSEQQFMAWNPALNGNCQGLWLDTWYCVGAFADIEYPLPAHQTIKPTAGNIPSGYPSDCTRWYQTTGDETCDLIALMFGSFSKADFVKWNPSVFSDCGGIVSQAWYCVGRPGTPTTRTGGASSPTQSVPSTRPTQSGIATACTDFWLVGPDDTCDSIARQAGISLRNFHSWNKAITMGSCAGLAPDYYVCVGVGSSAIPTTTQTTGTTSISRSTRRITSTTAPPVPVQTPSPVREGMASNCVRFYKQQPDQYCQAIASAAGISLTEFYSWNPATGSDCSNLWPDYYYCVGVSGPATTFNKRQAMPT